MTQEQNLEQLASNFVVAKLDLYLSIPTIKGVTYDTMADIKYRLEEGEITAMMATKELATLMDSL